MNDLSNTLQPIVEKMTKLIELGSKNNLLQSRYAKSPIQQLADAIIQAAYMKQASDIHFEPWEHDYLIRFRIDGHLAVACRLSKEIGTHMASYLKLASGMDIAEKRLPQDGSMLHGENKLDIRASAVPVLDGEKIVLRILGCAERMMMLEDMGFSSNDLAIFKRLIKSSSGIITITGPVNSGKSTLLYSVLNCLNRQDVNIVTVEDPVEMKLCGVSQMQVNQKSGLSFKACLQAVLRQDPDIVMIGEIRDETTAQQAVRAALTGRLVLTTLHTANAAGVPARLIDIGVQPSMLAITLLAATAQRLVRRICPDCAEEYSPGSNSLEAVVLGNLFYSGMKLKRGRGCSACCQSGYKGRTALYEIMLVDEEMKAAIAKNEIDLKIKRLLHKSRMKTMLDDGRTKILDGVTTAQEVWRVLNGTM